MSRRVFGDAARCTDAVRGGGLLCHELNDVIEGMMARTEPSAIPRCDRGGG